MSKTYLIRNFDDALHAAAKTVAAHLNVSLNKFILDAIHSRCLLVGHRDRITENVLKNVEAATERAKKLEPARS